MNCSIDENECPPLEKRISIKVYSSRSKNWTKYVSELGTQGTINQVRANYTPTQKFQSLYHMVVTFLTSVFLPKGYPDSVSEDYLSYQMWNAVQDFTNSITRTLATHAILKGAGVGNSAATPLAATLVWLMKDATGMMGSILFAHAKGSKFDSDSKKWRLFADVTNDLAWSFDLLCLVFPGPIPFAFLQCVSSLVKSLVGVAGGATRASLIQHQAKCNNMADIAAKDGSQETVTNLFALVSSMGIIHVVSDSTSRVWVVYLTGVALHLFANYRGIKCLNMPLINLARLGMMFDSYCESQNNEDSSLLTVQSVNRRETVWFFLPCPYNERIQTGEMDLNVIGKYQVSLQFIRDFSKKYGYWISMDVTKGKHTNVQVSFTEGSNVNDRILREGYLHCIVLKRFLEGKMPHITIDWTVGRVDQLLTATRKEVESEFDPFFDRLWNLGWDKKRILLSPGDMSFTFDD